MNSNKVVRNTMIGVGAVILLLLAPLIFVVVMSGFLFGLVAVFGLLAGAGLTPLANSVQRAVRNRSAGSVVALTPTTRRIASELGVPLVESVRPIEKPVAIIVRFTDGGCPLMRKPGDVFSVDPDGKS